MNIESLQQSSVLRRAILLPVLLAALYFGFSTATHYWDGVLFSLYIEKVAAGVLPFPTLFHANHLLYSPLGYGLFASLHSLGFQVRSITVLQVANTIASVACAVLLFRLCTRLYRSKGLAWSCTLLFALGATWWRFSTDADSYIIAVLLSLAAVACVLSERPRLILAGGFLTLAMLFHQLAIFMYVPIFASIWVDGKRNIDRLRRAGAFLLLTGVCVAIPYLVAYGRTHMDQSNQSFAAWITSVSEDTKTTRSLGQLLASNASSYVKLFGGGKLSLIRDFLSLPVIAALLFSVFSAVAALRSMFRAGRNGRPESSFVDRRSSTVFWSWTAVYFFFLSWFEPGNAFYKLFVWPPIVLLLGSYLDGRDSKWKQAFQWFTLALAGWNFAAFIYPHSQPEADAVLNLAMQIDKELPKSATVYYKALSPDDWYLEYFAPGRTWKLLPVPGEIRRATKESPVCFDTTALPYVQAETDPALRWGLVNSQHNIRLECVKTN